MNHSKKLWAPTSNLDKDTSNILLNMKRYPNLESLWKINIDIYRYLFRQHCKMAKKVMGSSIQVLHLVHYKSEASSKFISGLFSIFSHICDNSWFNAPRLLVVIQFIMQKLAGNFLVDKLNYIFDMQDVYNFLATFLVNKLLIPRGKMVYLAPFGSYKHHRAAEFTLCTQVFWNRLRQVRRPGSLVLMDVYQ